LGDGKGFRRASFGDRLTATYASNGVKTGRVRAYFSDGSQLGGAFTMQVESVPEAPCGRTWGTPGATQKSAFAASDDAYEGKKAYFTACAIYGDGHSSLEKPLILAEGFDIFGKLDINQIYDDYDELANGLTDMGFDVIILNFFKAQTYIQRNSEALITLLRDVNEDKTTREPNVVVGASMGGIVARYALMKMEVDGEEHETATYISFDSPHEGANIPLGLQYAAVFFSGVAGGKATEFMNILGRPAARQLLVYHWTASNNEHPNQISCGSNSSFPTGRARRVPATPFRWKTAYGMWPSPAAADTGRPSAIATEKLCPPATTRSFSIFLPAAVETSMERRQRHGQYLRAMSARRSLMEKTLAPLFQERVTGSRATSTRLHPALPPRSRMTMRRAGTEPQATISWVLHGI